MSEEKQNPPINVALILYKLEELKSQVQVLSSSIDKRFEAQDRRFDEGLARASIERRNLKNELEGRVYKLEQKSWYLEGAAEASNKSSLKWYTVLLVSISIIGLVASVTFGAVQAF